MTIAVCAECGAQKFGAFSSCEHCGFIPSSSSDRAKAVLLSDHHYGRDELGAISAAIQVGEKIEYDDESLTTYQRALSLLESDSEALQCARCGEDVDSFDNNLCAICRASTVAAGGIID